MNRDVQEWPVWEARRVGVVLFAFLVVWYGTTEAAPAPFQRSRPEPVPPLHCVMVWHSSRYRATFHRNGSYQATGPGITWTGSWSFDPESRLLVITERSERSDSWFTYTILVPRGSGELGSINGLPGFAFLKEQ